MTYIEYLTAMLGRFGLSAADISFILVEADLDGSSVVIDSGDRELIKTAVYMQLPRMIAGLQDVSEGGYSIKWNVQGLKLWYSALATELGLDDLLVIKPTIKDASFRW